MIERLGCVFITTGVILASASSTFFATMIVIICIRQQEPIGYLVASIMTGMIMAWWGLLITVLPTLFGPI